MTGPRAARDTCADARRAPPGSYADRMRIYFAEMLPLPKLGILSGLTTLAITGHARAVLAVPDGGVTGAGIASLATVFATVCSIYLMLRLMDDLKDEEIDRTLFPGRPLPSGRVRRTDIQGTLVAVALAYLLVSAASGSAAWSGLGVLAYLLLMFRLFFVPDLLRRSLLLSLATHAPIIPLMYVQGFVLCAHFHDVPLRDLDWPAIAAIVGMLWAMSESWEVARKTRAPARETDYVSYSRIAGARGAAAVVMGLQVTAVLVTVALWHASRLHWVALPLASTALVLALAGEIRFARNPAAGPADLERHGRRFGLVFLLAQVAGTALPASP